MQSKIISVILGGSRLQVPVGKDVGGDFKSIPLCRSADQVGCAMNFASFRADAPPPGDSLFGGSSGAGMEAACTNPAALSGGRGELHPFMASGAENIAAGNTDRNAGNARCRAASGVARSDGVVGPSPDDACVT